ITRPLFSLLHHLGDLVAHSRAYVTADLRPCLRDAFCDQLGGSPPLPVADGDVRAAVLRVHDRTELVQVGIEHLTLGHSVRARRPSLSLLSAHKETERAT